MCKPKFYMWQKNEEEIMTFRNKQKLKDFIPCRPVPQEMLKGILQTEIRGY